MRQQQLPEAQKWDNAHRHQRLGAKGWRWDNKLGCLIPEGRPCSYCAKPLEEGYLCDPCAERWMDIYFRGWDEVVAAVAMLNEPDVKSRCIDRTPQKQKKKNRRQVWNE